MGLHCLKINTVYINEGKYITQSFHYQNPTLNFLTPFHMTPRV